jgi:hypothetical protein
MLRLPGEDEGDPRLAYDPTRMYSRARKRSFVSRNSQASRAEGKTSAG